MHKEWKEGQDKVVRVPKDDPEVFHLYAQLVYTDKIPGMDHMEARLSDKIFGTKSYVQVLVCAKSSTNYYLACMFWRKLMDRKAKNRTVDALISKIIMECADVDYENSDYRCLPRNKAINIMFNGSPDLCHVQWVIIDAYVFYGSARNFEHAGRRRELPTQFIWNMAKNVMYNRDLPMVNPLQENPRGYHERKASDH